MIKIYTDEHAALCKESAGKPYRPSSGSEGELFMGAWCGNCQRDKSMREGAPLEECDDNELCGIIADTFAYAVNEPGYPAAWRYGADGQPQCSAYVEAGQPIPSTDDHTPDMFATSKPEGEA